MSKMASPLYEGLNEVKRLIASLDKQMNLHNTSPVCGVGSAPDLGFKGAVLHAKVRNCLFLQNGELGLLTRDMAAAIYMYTIDSNFS